MNGNISGRGVAPVISAAWFFASDTRSCSLRRLFVSLSPIADNWSVGPACGYFWSGLNSFSLSTERMRIVFFPSFLFREEKRRLSFKNSIPNFLCVKWNILGNIWPRDDCVAFTRDEIQFKGTERHLPFFPEKFEDVESKFLNETTKKIRSERNNTRIP